MISKEALEEIKIISEMYPDGIHKVETFSRWQDPTIKDMQEEITRLNKQLELKTDFIKDILKAILKSEDYKMQKEVYELGKVYDIELKEGK